MRDKTLGSEHPDGAESLGSLATASRRTEDSTWIINPRRSSLPDRDRTQRIGQTDSEVASFHLPERRDLSGLAAIVHDNR